MSFLAPTRAQRRLWWAALILVGLAMGANMLRRANKGSSDYPPTAEFGRSLLLEGENVYVTRPAGATHNKYPPSFFVLTAPFALAPFLVGAALFYAANFLAVLAAAWLTVAALKPAAAGRPRFGEVFLPLLFTAPLIGTNLMLGQVNPMVLACIAACLYLVSKHRALAAGVAVVVATALKLTPALLIVGFAWKRGWTVLLGAGLGLVLCFGLLPALALGPTQATEATRGWTRVLAGFAQEGAGAEARAGQVIGYRQTNQSIDAAAHRLLSEVPAMPARSDRAALYVNVASLAPDAPVLTWLVTGTAVLLVLALMWLARGPLATTGRLALGLDVALALIVILAISPISWNSYFVALLVPHAVALEAARRRPAGDPLRRWLHRAVGTAFGLTILGLCPYARVFSVLLLAALVLGVALACARSAERRAHRGPAGARTAAEGPIRGDSAR